MFFSDDKRPIKFCKLAQGTDDAPGDEELRTTSKSHMLYGVIGMFIMMSVFGIMRVILNSLGENHIKITDTGEVSIAPRSGSGFTNIGDTVIPPPNTNTIGGNPFVPQNTNTKDQNTTTINNISKTTVTDINSTFKISDSSTTTPGTGSGDTSGELKTQNESNPALLDAPSAAYVADMKLRYKSDDKYYNVVASGVSSSIQGAKEQAVLNARITVANQKGATSIDKVYNTGILEEKVWKVGDSYHYWLAMSSFK